MMTRQDAYTQEEWLIQATLCKLLAKSLQLPTQELAGVLAIGEYRQGTIPRLHFVAESSPDTSLIPPFRPARRVCQFFLKTIAQSKLCYTNIEQTFDAIVTTNSALRNGWSKPALLCISR
jgi:hypothetical protein